MCLHMLVCRILGVLTYSMVPLFNDFINKQLINLKENPPLNTYGRFSALSFIFIEMPNMGIQWFSIHPIEFPEIYRMPSCTKSALAVVAPLPAGLSFHLSLISIQSCVSQ